MSKRRNIKVSYELKVSLDRPQHLNEQAFLQEVRNAIQAHLNITPRVSVLRKVEETING